MRQIGLSDGAEDHIREYRGPYPTGQLIGRTLSILY
jgi:hypothetical protein